MARTTSALVQGVLAAGKDYDTANAPDLTPYIDAASAIVDRVNTCSGAKGMALTSTELELVERWLAAHCYTRSDKAFQAKNTGPAGATFQGQTGLNLDGSFYGQQAMALDYSGCLAAISKRAFAGAVWMGKPVSSQIDYTDRD